MDLIQLWAPILFSGVVVFVASFLAWVVLPHHKKDVKVVPDERALTEHLERLALPPGMYLFPNCQTAEEMKSEAFRNRYKEGPWGSINLLASPPSFPRNLALVFLFYLVLSLVVGYITSLACAPGAEYMAVFRVAGTVAIVGYCFGSIPNAIFFGKPLRFVLTDLVDGLVYGLLTAGVFAWLWPAAA